MKRTITTTSETTPVKRSGIKSKLRRIRRGSLSRRLWSGSRGSMRNSRTSNRDYTSFFPEGVA